ncbi:DNA-binding transcriptional LysR family regulator [Paraburkholderia sp. 32]
MAPTNALVRLVASVADLRAGRLVQVLPEYRLPDIDVLALYPSRRHVSAKVRAAIDFLVNAFSGVPPWDEK